MSETSGRVDTAAGAPTPCRVSISTSSRRKAKRGRHRKTPQRAPPAQAALLLPPEASFFLFIFHGTRREGVGKPGDGESERLPRRDEASHGGAAGGLRLLQQYAQPNPLLLLLIHALLPRRTLAFVCMYMRRRGRAHQSCIAGRPPRAQRWFPILSSPRGTSIDPLPWMFSTCVVAYLLLKLISSPNLI